MKSQVNPTLANLRKLLLITALVICPLLAFQTGNAQTATATLLSGGLSSITITGNQSFVLTLGVTTNFTSTGYTVFYQSNDASGGFTLSNPTARTNLSPIDGTTMTNVFNDPTTTDFNLTSGSNGLLSPSHMFDAGFTGDQIHNQAAGTFNLQSIQITALNLAPGTYHIFLDNRSIMSNAVNPLDINMGGPSGPIFTVTVVPEPGTIGLALLGGTALLLMVRRRAAFSV